MDLHRHFAGFDVLNGLCYFDKFTCLKVHRVNRLLDQRDIETFFLEVTLAVLEGARDLKLRFKANKTGTA